MILRSFASRVHKSVRLNQLPHVASFPSTIGTLSWIGIIFIFPLKINTVGDVPGQGVLETLHERWVGLLRSLSPEDLDREFIHPESGPTKLAESIGAYAWHGRHHLAHIENTVRREGWI